MHYVYLFIYTSIDLRMLKQLRCQGLFWNFACCHIHRSAVLSAVSYTHLDVYKRQASVHPGAERGTE